MPSADTAKFLDVALNIQSEPYAGVHVADGVIAATNGVMLVAAKWGVDYLRGEGTISPKAARILKALAEVAYIGSISVGKANRNRVTVTAQSTRYDETTNSEVSGEFQTVELPEFYCRQIPIRRMVGMLTDEGWVHLVNNPQLTNIREWSVREYVALMMNPRENYELFRLKDVDDALWYSVAQLRRGLRLFGARARLNVRRNSKGWLAFEDNYGQTFAITPFVKHE